MPLGVSSTMLSSSSKTVSGCAFLIVRKTYTSPVSVFASAFASSVVAALCKLLLKKGIVSEKTSGENGGNHKHNKIAVMEYFIWLSQSDIIKTILIKLFCLRRCN